MSESEDKLGRVKAFIIESISNSDAKTSENNLKLLKEWFTSENYRRDFEQINQKKEVDIKLMEISRELKKILPWNSILPSEKISAPKTGALSMCNDKNTYNVDEFLYDDSEFEDLLEEKGIRQQYCVDCGSNDIKEVHFLSHSLSRSKMKYMFGVLLPKDLSKMRLLDIGSRIGAVLYGAYFHTNCQEIFGVEINKEFCDIQNKLVSEYHMKQRVKVINDDIATQEDIVATSDVIIINNAFEFFMEMDAHVKIWKFLRKNLKQGSILVTLPSLEETLSNLDIYDEFKDWFEKCDPFQEENAVYFDEESMLNFNEMYLYKIRQL